MAPLSTRHTRGGPVNVGVAEYPALTNAYFEWRTRASATDPRVGPPRSARIAGANSQPSRYPQSRRPHSGSVASEVEASTMFSRVAIAVSQQSDGAQPATSINGSTTKLHYVRLLESCAGPVQCGQRLEGPGLS